MLRKTMIALTLLVMVSGVASAALLPTFGLKAGMNFSSINTSDLESSNRTGFAGGLFVDFASPLIHIQGEVLYTQKGFEQGTLTSAHKFDYRSDFIEIPVVLKFGLPIPAVTPSIYIGPALSFAVKNQVKESDNGEWEDVSEYAESSVWSLVMGVDVTLLDWLMVDLRYDFGLTAIQKTSIAENLTDLDEDIKDRTLSLMVGIRF